MSFGTPLLLLALLLIPAAVLSYWFAQRRRSIDVVRFTNVDLLVNLVPRMTRWRRHVPAALYLLAAALLIVGLARPQREVQVPRENATVILAVDVSLSMFAEDVDPDRLTAAKAAALRFAEQLPPSVKLGVVSFSGAAKVKAIPDTDRDEQREAIEELEPEEATAMGDGIEEALEVGELSLDQDSSGEPAEDGESPLAILLLSDGFNTIGRDPIDAAGDAEDAGVPIYTIALGTPEGTVEVPDPVSGVPILTSVPPDTATLEEIAEMTGGQYFAAPTSDDLRDIYDQLGSVVGYDEEQREITTWFVGAALPLLLIGAGLSMRWFARFP